MVKTLEAIFDGQVLHLEEPVDLEPNTRVRITIETVEAEPVHPPSFLQTARSLRLEGPPDWSTKVDDYLYGAMIDDQP